MKTTPFFSIHTQLGAKMALFGGYQMPIQYSGVKQEHLSVRERLGVFDVSHMGEFMIEGPQSKALLQRICSNDIEKLFPGKAQYNYLPNEKGGVVDDLIVYQLEDQKYLLVVNASNIEKDWNWIQKQNIEFQATLTDVSEQTALLAIQGPKAIVAMQTICNADLGALQQYSHVTTRFAGVENVLVATTGYTGAGGIEIYFDPQYAVSIWNAILQAGADFGILPVGLAARDTLRLEMGYCLYGHEIDNDTSPISAGLGWITRPETDFIMAKHHKKTITTGTKELLVGFEMDQRGIPRSGYLIFDAQQNPIGRVTSGTQSPSLDKGIGLGFVEKSFSNLGRSIWVQIRDKFVPATVVKLPFVK
jgi:aminomethyltransferase